MALALVLPFVAVGSGVARREALSGRRRSAYWRCCSVTCSSCCLGGLVWARTGQVVPLSTGWAGHLLDGLTIGVGRAPRRGTPVPRDVRALMRRVIDRCGFDDDALLGRRHRGPAGGRGLSRPTTVFELLLLKAARAWYGTWAGWFEPIIALLQAPYLLLAPSARPSSGGGGIATMGSGAGVLLVLLITGTSGR